MLSPEEIRPLAADLVGVDVTTAPASPTTTTAPDDDVPEGMDVDVIPDPAERVQQARLAVGSGLLHLPDTGGVFRPMLGLPPLTPEDTEAWFNLVKTSEGGGATGLQPVGDDLKLGRTVEIATGRIANRLKQQATRLAAGGQSMSKATYMQIGRRATDGLPAGDVEVMLAYMSEQWDKLPDDLIGFESVLQPDGEDRTTDQLRGLMRTRAQLRGDQIQRRITQAHTREQIRADGGQQFMWVTQGDEKVRPAHEDVDGQVFSLATGHPELGFPGDPPNCRCVAVPVENVATEAPAQARGDKSYRPPEAVRAAAQRALEVRRTKPASQRGMTAVGISRARDLAAGRAVSEETIRRMVSYFARHEVDKEGSTWKDQGKGWQAWHGWGGDAGRAWAEKTLREIEQAKGDDQGAKTPAAPEERITGSRRNPAGSASGKRGGIKITEAVEKALQKKAREHNEKHTKAAQATDVGALKAVWRRGAGAFSATHRPGMSRQQWAMGRVNAFLYLLRNGRPENSKYTTDNDLLPKDHPRYSAEDKES